MFHNLPQGSRMFHELPECSMSFQNIPECSIMFHNVPWCSMMFHDLLWCSMTFYDMCWVFMSLREFLGEAWGLLLRDEGVLRLQVCCVFPIWRVLLPHFPISQRAFISLSIVTSATPMCDSMQVYLNATSREGPFLSLWGSNETQEQRVLQYVARWSWIPNRQVVSHGICHKLL